MAAQHHFTKQDPVYGPQPDLEAMCREAGVPADDPAALRLVHLVAEYCASVCDGAEPEGDAAGVPPEHAKATGAELGVKLRGLFGVG